MNYSEGSHCARNGNHRLDDAPSQSETKPWNHWSVMFVHSDIADAKIPPGPLRLLAHLQRRIGERTDKNAHINPGIDSMGRVCRMEKKRVIRDLRWLAAHGLIPGKAYLAMFLGRGGKNHRYRVLVSKRIFRIDPRLDDAKLSVAEFAVLCYMSNAADQGGFCYPAKPTTIAQRCGLSLNTVKKVLQSLLEKGYYEASDIGENRPKIVWELLLERIYPPLEGENVKSRNQNCQKPYSALSKAVTKEYPLLRVSTYKNIQSEKPTACVPHAPLVSDSSVFCFSSEEVSERAIPPHQKPDQQTSKSDTKKDFSDPHTSFNGSSLPARAIAVPEVPDTPAAAVVAASDPAAVAAARARAAAKIAAVQVRRRVWEQRARAA